jgi:hypothetical protein
MVIGQIVLFLISFGFCPLLWCNPLFELPTPTCLRELMILLFLAKFERKCSDERVAIYLPGWILPVTRFALAGSFCGLYSGIVALFCVSHLAYGDALGVQFLYFSLRFSYLCIYLFLPGQI